MDLKDVASERAILSGIVQHPQGYLDVCDMIQSDCFTTLENQTLYTVLSYIRSNNPHAKIDQHLILSVAKDLNLQKLITSDDQYLGRMMNFKVELENIRDYAKRVKRLKLYRELYGTGSDAFGSLSKLSGSEPITQALAIVEKPIFDFINNITIDNSSAVEHVGVGLTEYLDNLEANPLEVLGIPLPFKIYQEAIGGMAEGVHVITARPKVGKAQPLSAVIHTVNGPKLNKDIKVGDLVCTENGKCAAVTHIHPQGFREVYRVTFKHGDFVECDGDHLWKVKKGKSRKYQVLPIKDLIGKEKEVWSAPLPLPAAYNYTNNSIDPYILGFLLHLGFFGESILFTCKDKNLTNHMNVFIGQNFQGYYCNNRKNRGSVFIITHGKMSQVNHFKESIKELGLFKKRDEERFIPKSYLYNGPMVRLFLLRGLMDAGGLCVANHYEYPTPSKKLADDVKFLVNSLGGIAKIRTINNQYTVEMYFNHTVPFRVGKHLDKAEGMQRSDLAREISKIEHIGKRKCQCITIDSENGLYLTDNFIVTHNSTVAVNVALHVSIKEKIPVLFLDTELRKESGQWARLLARISGIEFKTIRSGQYGQNELSRKKVRKAEHILKTSRLDYANITGRDFDEVLSMIRRWLIQKVGYNQKGELNPCLLVYDYLKLTGVNEKKNMQEYEAIGYRLSGMHDISMSYKFPCLTFCQLNREFDVSQSDRIRWYCTSLAALMKKEEEELAEDGRENGNRKLILQDCRFGEGLDDGDYINMRLDGKTTTLTELSTRNQLNRDRNDQALEPDPANENF